MLDSFGRRMYRARWAIVAAWLCLFVLASIFAPRVTGILRGGGYTIGNSQSVAAYNLLNKTYGYRALTFTAVFSAPNGARDQLKVAATRFRVEAHRRFGHQLTISQPITTPDGAVVFERVFSAPQEDLGSHFAGPLRELLPHGRVRGYLT
ncbi:MAG TPA: hypothetical protein VF898_12295, partial [Chloroflexota bacterium]